MISSLFRGELVCLVALDPETDAQLLSKWSRNSEYHRLFSADPARPWSADETRREMGKQVGRVEDTYFLARTLADDTPIGIVDLGGVQLSHGDAWLGVGIGERDYWGRGFGTDASRVALRYAFTELNLHRVSLNVFEYNTRALRAYQKLGFVVEGRVREFLERDGRRWDLIFMGLLRSEWEKGESGPGSELDFGLHGDH